MGVTLKFDTSKLNDQLYRAQQELKKEMPDLIKDEARLLLKQAIKFTPPKTKKQGTDAIYSDIFERKRNKSGGIFVTILPYMTPEAHPSGVRLFTATNGYSFGVTPDNYMPNASVQAMKDIHNKARTGARGRPSRAGSYTRDIGRWKWIERMAVGERSANRYFKYISRHVGRMKAGWLPAYAALEGSLPKWIDQHYSGARGIVINQLKNAIFPKFTLGNTSLGIAHLRNAFQSALNVRAKSLKKKINYELKGNNKLKNVFKS